MTWSKGASRHVLFTLRFISYQICFATTFQNGLIAIIPGPWFNMKMTSHQYRKSHCGDKTILRPSYLHNGISYTDKMTFLYWIRPWMCLYQTDLQQQTPPLHLNDVIMGTIVSQITSLAIVYSAVYSDADQRKHQSSASLAFVRGIHRGPVNSPHKGPVTREMFPFDDVIMDVVPRKVVTISTRDPKVRKSDAG